jgi:hypothetical protein
MTPATTTPPSPGRVALRWAGRIATIVVSAAIIYYFLRKVEWAKLKEAAESADLALALVGMLTPLFAFWITDAIFTVKSFAWFDKPVPLRDYLAVKGAAYLLTLVNITFSTTGVFLYFMRKTGISVPRQAGLLAWRVTVSTLGALIFLALFILAVASFAPGIAAGLGARYWVPFVVLTAVLTAAVTAFSFWCRGPVLARIARGRAAEVLAAFGSARLRHWLIGFAYTTPNLVLNFVGMFMVARAFHVEVPFFHFLFWIPVVLVFAALPIAFGQLGTTTAAWQFFFAAYGTKEDIIAATIFIPAVRLVWRAAAGLISMPFALRELESIKPAKEEEHRDPETQRHGEKNL